MRLSILICSLESRKDFRERLLLCLESQIAKIDSGQVEILTDIDNGEKDIGEKRNDLLARASGDYIAFIDDDDLVSKDYIDKIMKAIDEEPDCVGIHLVMYTNGTNSEHSYHSLQYNDWWSEHDPDNGRRKHFRTPNHLNPVKRELALKVGFPSSNHGEDRDYSLRLKDLLESEVYIEEPIYFYYYNPIKEYKV